MPIHDLGYRKWTGQPGRDSLRWIVIAQSGIRLAWKSLWLKRLLLVAWTPALLLGAWFFAYERYCDYVKSNEEVIYGQNLDRLDEATRRFLKEEQIRRMTGQFPPPAQEAIQPILKSVVDNPEEARHDVWAMLLLVFFRYPQGVLMVLVVGLIAPQLISSDVRSRAFLAYFSRPIGRLDYIVGKSAVVWCYLALITTAPALVLYIIGVLLSPHWTVVFDTWDLPLRIMAASALLLIPTTMLALMFSSMTSETRYAQYAWYSVWALGWVAYLVLAGTGDFWTEVSLFHVLWAVQGWVFGMETELNVVFWPFVILAAITVGSWFILNRNVSAPMRI